MSTASALGIQRHYIEKRQAWQSYIETAFNIQRRMADEAETGFRAARTWDALWHAHATWMNHYNNEDHWAHRGRQDERSTPSAVLAWVRGRRYTEAELRRAVYAMRFIRRLNRVGYAQFKRWRIYGEISLAGQSVVIWLDQDMVTVTYAEQSLRRYAATVDRHAVITALDQGMTLPHAFQSHQLHLWDVIAKDWQMSHAVPERPTLRRYRPYAIQLLMDLDAA